MQTRCEPAGKRRFRTDSYTRRTGGIWVGLGDPQTRASLTSTDSTAGTCRGDMPRKLFQVLSLSPLHGHSQVLCSRVSGSVLTSRSLWQTEGQACARASQRWLGMRGQHEVPGRDFRAVHSDVTLSGGTEDGAKSPRGCPLLGDC